jgi:hypothetical protein
MTYDITNIGCLVDDYYNHADPRFCINERNTLRNIAVWLFRAGVEVGKEKAHKDILSKLYMTECELELWSHDKRRSENIIHTAIPGYLAKAYSEGIISGYSGIMANIRCPHCGKEL